MSGALRVAPFLAHSQPSCRKWDALKILDGRRRYLACKKTGLRPRFANWDCEGSPLDYVVSANIHRRHLTPSQRAVLALDLLAEEEAKAKGRQRLSRGRGKKGGHPCPTSTGKATEHGARRVGCSARLVQTAKRVRDSRPGLIDEIRSGRLTVSEAHRRLAVPPSQAHSARSGPNGRRKIIPASIPSGFDPKVELICGDALTELRKLPSNAVHCCLTSIPYYLQRDYGVKGQYGLEETVGEWVAQHVAVFREVWRVLRDDGTLWMNVADSYVAPPSNSKREPYSTPALKKAKRRAIQKAHLQRKCLFFAPQRLAIAMTEDVWIARAEIIVEKNNTDGCRNRPVRTHEYLHLFTKTDRYLYDADALRVDYAPTTTKKGYSTTPRLPKSADYDRTYELHPGGKLRGSIWRAGPATGAGDHPAPMSLQLAVDCVLGGCPEGGTVLDPFVGSGTTAVAAAQNGRHCIGIDLSKKYLSIAEKRLPGAKIAVQ